MTPYLIARYCRLKNLSRLYGMSWTAYAFGAAIGPVVTGRAFGQARAYQSSFIMLLALPRLAGALLTLFLPQYKTRQRSERSLEMAAPSPSAH